MCIRDSPFTSYQKEDNRVSLIGDTHPVFHGSVVKAIASGLRTYPKIIASLQPKLAKPPVNDYQEFAAIMQQYFQARVTKITRKTPEIFELTIAAPLASQQFKPGQFYRLQNFENTALVKENTLLQMEPFIVVGADCDKTAGTLTFIIKESTVTAKLCATLKENDFVSLMGPTGVRTKIPHEQETLLIIGDQASFPFLRSVGRAAREAGNFVMFIGIFDHANDVYCREELESAADLILWLTKSAEIIPANPTRMNDKTFVYTDLNTAFHKLNSHEYILNDVDRVYLVGEVDLLRDFQSQRKELVKEFFFKNPKVFGSVYGSMQCMLKGVCAQCLQWQIDPETGLRTKAVFACSWQDQPLELIDLDHMQIRQFQNHFLEKFNALWVDYIFAKHALKTV